MHVAEQQLAQLAVSDRTRHYAWQVRELHEATECLYAVYDDWLSVRAALPESARPGTTAYEDSLAESYAEAWPYVDQWAIHGQALFAVNALAERQSRVGAPTAVAALRHPPLLPLCGGERRGRVHRADAHLAPLSGR
ncbi:hypothetical protein NKH18_47960 [Streptomyces sp. M10(2022)]